MNHYLHQNCLHHHSFFYPRIFYLLNYFLYFIIYFLQDFWQPAQAEYSVYFFQCSLFDLTLPLCFISIHSKFSLSLTINLFLLCYCFYYLEIILDFSFISLSFSIFHHHFNCSNECFPFISL